MDIDTAKLKLTQSHPPHILRIRLLQLLRDEGRANTMTLARKTGKLFVNVNEKLYLLKRDGLVNCEVVRRFFERHGWIMTREWWITQKGIEWLKQRGL